MKNHKSRNHKVKQSTRAYNKVGFKRKVFTPKISKPMLESALHKINEKETESSGLVVVDTKPVDSAKPMNELKESINKIENCQCNKCDQTFKKEADLLIHLNLKHADVDPKELLPRDNNSEFSKYIWISMSRCVKHFPKTFPATDAFPKTQNETSFFTLFLLLISVF